MHLAFKYRLYPNASQKEMIAKHFGCARFAYNYALALKIKTWETEKKHLSQFDLCKVFPTLKKEEGKEWLSEVCSHALQCEMAHLDIAYTKFFKERKGFPKFKSKHTDRKSYSTNVSISVGESSVKLPKMGKVRAVISRPITGKVVKATISQAATGKYFVSILCEWGKPPEKTIPTEENTLGIDLGITHFCTFSTGEKIENPRFFKKSLKRLRRAQRTLSRRKKGSNNKKRQARRVAAIHEHVSNQRRDFQHKLSTRIIRENQAVALETLNVSGMQKNNRLACSIADVGWSQFVEMLEYKAERHGKTVLRIGLFEPSSKLCSCGSINRSLKLSDRIWTCECGSTHDRDHRAALNIKGMALHPKLGRETPESTLGEILV